MKQLSNRDKIMYVYRVAMTCKTLEQFRIINKWIAKIPLDKSEFEGYYDRRDMLKVIEIARQNVFKWDKE